MQSLNVSWQNISRHADIYKPAQLKLPLQMVLMFHGAGGDSIKAMEQTGWCELADREGFLLVCPNGLPVDTARKSSFLRNPQVWNSGVERGLAYVPEIDDVGYIDTLITQVSKMFPLDERKVFAAGFSNGGGMCWRLALELSHRFAAIAPVCAYMSAPEPWNQKQFVSAVAINCLDDPFIPLEGGMVKDIWSRVDIQRPSVIKDLSRYAALSGCQLTSEQQLTVEVTRRTYGSGEEDALIEFYTIANAGHAWPGGPALLSERIAGKPTNAMDATQVIWQFFAAAGQKRRSPD